MPGEDINPNAEPGELDTLEGVTQMQTVDMELDLTRGEVTNPMDACAHLEGVEPEMPLEEGGGTAGENASIEVDKDPCDPCVKLQEPRASHLATPEEDKFLTSSLSPITPEATPATPEPDRGADLDPPLHDTPPPDEAGEPPTQQLPEQIRDPTEAGGQLESLRSEQTRRATA